jgi:glycosyltransferase involved in cell wall biosynthesis
MIELVRPGVEGLVVPPRDPSALADAIEQLVRAPHRRHELGTRGRERVLDSFTIERQAEVFSGHYERLIGSKA